MERRIQRLPRILRPSHLPAGTNETSRVRRTRRLKDLGAKDRAPKSILGPDGV